MRREGWVVLGVLVPFGLLVALGVWWTKAPAPLPLAVAPAHQPVPLPQGAPLPPAPAPAPVSPTPRAPPPAPAAPPRLTFWDDADFPAPLRAPLKAVSSEVRLCLSDVGERLRGRVEVTVDFRALPDGGFAGVVVQSSWPDPQLSACVTDVFEELGFTPTGLEPVEAARHTFVVETAAR